MYVHLSSKRLLKGSFLWTPPPSGKYAPACPDTSMKWVERWNFAVRKICGKYVNMRLSPCLITTCCIFTDVDSVRNRGFIRQEFIFLTYELKKILELANKQISLNLKIFFIKDHLRLTRQLHIFSFLLFVQTEVNKSFDYLIPFSARTKDEIIKQ